MKANQGDWLIVHSHNDAAHIRKAEIIGTADSGEPPYKVRWVEDDRESVVFPGPDAQVLSAEQEAELNRQQSAQIDRFQSALTHTIEEAQGVRS